MDEMLKTARSIHRLFVTTCLLLIYTGLSEIRHEGSFDSQASDTPPIARIFGVEVPFDMVWYVGPLGVLGLQLWFLAHLFHLREKSREAPAAFREFAWVILFSSRFARVLTCVANIVTPLLAYASLRIVTYIVAIWPMLFDELWRGLLIGCLAAIASVTVSVVTTIQIAHLWQTIHGRSYFAHESPAP